MIKGSSFSSIAVLGPGLLGGSIIKAINFRQPKCDLRIWARRLEVLSHSAIKEVGASVVSTDIAKVVEDADLVILAMPIQHMVSLVEQFPTLDGTVVTDVGSTKVLVVNQLTELVQEKGGQFIGSHPMAGSEKTGIDHASEDLFDGAAIVLTPTEEEVDSDPVQGLKCFWESLGGTVHFASPERHDDVVAAISHLPHLLAAALVRSAVSGRDDLFSQLVGGGFRDTSRIAGGDPEMWTEIMMANQVSLLDELEKFIEELGSWKQALARLDKDEVQLFLSEAQACRNEIEQTSKSI